jgi:FKBP-type peptidyl-prolyl cis-trans isomerase
MKKTIISQLLVIGLILVSSCKDELPKENKTPKTKKEQLKEILNLQSSSSLNQQKFENGLTITWHTLGTGNPVKDDKVYLMNYVLLNQDSVEIESSIAQKRVGLPYVAGWSLHTMGMDFAMSQLRVGDWVTVNIPAIMVVDAHGNAPKKPRNQILKLKILSELKPNRIVDGIKVWKLEGSSKETLFIDSTSSVTIHYIASSKSNPKFDESYTRRQPFNFQMYNSNVVPGLKKALINAKKFDRLLIMIPSKEAYGNKGYLDYVRPNEQLFYNISIEEVKNRP